MRNERHGLSKTRLYGIYSNMKQRCYNPNDPIYIYYGGKGITICQEWLDNFMNFYNWAMANGYRDDLTIDRIDSNKGYSPDNCRWITRRENSARANHSRGKITNSKIEGIRALTGLTQKQFAEKYHITFSSIRNWESGHRTCPDYVEELLEYKIKKEKEEGSMKSKEEILKDFYAALAELQGTSWSEENGELEKYLRIKLTVLYDILGEEVPEEYWEQVEEWTV